MSSNNQSYTIDQITVDLLASLPDLSNDVIERIKLDFEFMDNLGSFLPKSETIDHIDIIAWAQNRIIHKICFSDGSVLADCRYRLPDKKALPASLLMSPCIQTLGHPIFAGYSWDPVPEDIASGYSIRDVENHYLGHDPSQVLSQLIQSADRKEA